MKSIAPLAVACGLALLVSAGIATSQSNKSQRGSNPKKEIMQEDKVKESNKDAGMLLGNFSVSLTVKDIKASKAFYEKLDFKVVGGKLEQNYLILQNRTTTIGLFHGMFEKNIMTFNPGWTKDQETLKEFDDVRALQAELVKRGITPVVKADETTDGPANFVIVDPDGNTIYFDQHVPKGK